MLVDLQDGAGFFEDSAVVPAPGYVRDHWVLYGTP